MSFRDHAGSSSRYQIQSSQIVRRRRPAGWAILLLSLLVSGCGLNVPAIKEAWDGPRGTEQIEFEIKKRVYCDLREAVRKADNIPYFVEDRATGRRIRKPIIPDQWGAQISLLLQVDEAGALNPGVALTEPLRNAITPFSNGNVTSPQSFSLGLGGTLSSTATRIDKFDPYYPIAFLRKPDTKDSPCYPQNDPFLANGQVPASSSLLLQSDLGIDRWLEEAMFTNVFLPSVNPGASKNKDTPDTVSLEIKFIVVSSANVNPTWKLVRVTANNGNAPLLSAGRTRTHDLIITIGPSNERTRDTHLASQIGQAVNSGRVPIP
jgi:hypothetical protein